MQTCTCTTILTCALGPKVIQEHLPCPQRSTPSVLSANQTLTIQTLSRLPLFLLPTQSTILPVEHRKQ